MGRGSQKTCPAGGTGRSDTVVAPEPAAVEDSAPVYEHVPVEPPPAAIDPPIALVADRDAGVTAVEASAQLDEPVLEISDDRDATQAQSEPPETITVALPGETHEEVPLSGVHDDAIQIVDDEPQGVPTEEEVDAMLAATASAILNSGLSAEEPVVEEAARPLPNPLSTNPLPWSRSPFRRSSPKRSRRPNPHSN